ncbi:MAG TPA: flagellar biosynthesis protein FlhA [Clostridium sp.]|uniref:Flagellar biosynthesis protein FlhA n=2 Tax=Clostridiaceae TaxID=31979 RepID=A0ABV4DSW0_9CLOT|nr:flagellar biosynthesis protein FlhA [uncultured Clostridium sp.]NLU08017.1 flagellar biosynthesis protein FlhA [Clostridiales bacterium]HBC95900.1 flagellar biosynthesis protein FlhA [Clostridium sp.]
MERSRSRFKLKDNAGVLMALMVVMIVFMIIIPLPAKLLDILIAFNIALSIIIILLTMFTTEVLQFSVFPTLLLVTTLFRLALNISSVRLILRDAYAGEVIDSFGEFVVGGSYLVGIIIFLIIIIIQFIVITNGANRVAEVSARFTLDAMPGKQMSIDADLNSGLIDEKGARVKRSKLQREADFYGAMDGASKFVKGDAIAALVIVMINIIAGIITGIVIKGMDISQAAQTYTKLTIGDGLVSQIPALLISTASGILVTRSESDEDFGTLAVKQLLGFPKVIAIAGAVLLFLAIIPGLPHLAFLILAAACIIASYLLHKDEVEQSASKAAVQNQKAAKVENKEPENVMNLISVEPMEIEIGYGLIPLADESSGGDLLQRITSVRRQCAIEMGIVVQPIRIRDNLQLKTNDYVIKIRGTIVAKGELMPNMLLCMNPAGSKIDIQGISTKEPSFGLPAIWINRDQREEAEIKGLTVVDPTTVLITHLTETIKNHSYELMGRQEVKLILDSVKEKYPTVVEELVPDLLTIGEVQKVLQNLLRERVPIKDMVTILESLADNSRNTKDIELLTEYVRFALGRSICNSFIDENGTITVITLSKNLEKLIGDNIQKSMQGSFPAIDPDTTGKIFKSLRKMLDSVYFYENQPVVLVSPKIRAPFRRLIEMVFPSVNVLSLNEIPNDVQIKTEGVVSI